MGSHCPQSILLTDSQVLKHDICSHICGWIDSCRIENCPLIIYMIKPASHQSDKRNIKSRADFKAKIKRQKN